MKNARFTLFCIICALLPFVLFACDDDSSSQNNANNVNNVNNINNINNNNINNINNVNNVNNINNINNINNVNNVNNLTCDPPCASWEVCEAGTPSNVCRVPEGWTWTHLAVTISDPVVNGTSLMTPVDGLTLGHDAAGHRLFTSYGHDVDTETVAHLWHLDTVTGVHAKTDLTGTVLPSTENFCTDENWCQFIHFDAASGEVWVTGPRASGILRVDAGTWVGRVDATSGTRPANSHIDHAHLFVPEEGALFVFGATTPSGFGDALFRLDLATGAWSQVVVGLPNRGGNCLAVDPVARKLYSFGGQHTEDGGVTSAEVADALVIDLAAGTHDVLSFPVEMGARAQVSCAFDGTRGVFFVFGGAVVVDYWNDALNTFHNDLWSYEPVAGAWELLLADVPGGTLTDPDEYGDRTFEGFPEGPNFGQHRGRMLHDATADRLWLVGEVPRFPHQQPYYLELSPQ